MKNISRHIAHWKDGARESVETAEILISKNKILFGLFFCHLAIEKQLKAVYIKENEDFPPKTHKLLHLAHKSNIKLNAEIKIFFSKLMEFQLEGRYPEIITTTLNYDKAVSLLEKTKEVLIWLQQM